MSSVGSDADKGRDVRQEFPVFYKNQMNLNYRIDESIIKKIIKKEVSVIDPVRNKLGLYIYYKNLKLFNLVIKNDRTSITDPLQQSHVVYHFKCSIPHCKVDTYIGHTTTTLSRRLTMHLQFGSILNHYECIHLKKLTRKELEEGVSILTSESDSFRLKIKEALYILLMRPAINKQFDKFPQILHLFGVKESNMHRLPCIPSNDEDNINDDTSDSSSDTNTLAVEAAPDESHCNVSEEILVSSNITQRKRKN